jgi:hypothetical protein
MDREDIVALFGFILGIVILSSLSIAVKTWKCDSKWDYKTTYKPFVGCLVHTTDGLVPSENFIYQGGN